MIDIPLHVDLIAGQPLAQELQAAGYLILPAPAEPHAHLDKALTADRLPNQRGDLIGAIDVWIAHRATITKADYIERAQRAALMGLANGFTAIRTHIDLAADVGTVSIEALLEVKRLLADRIDIQLVGLVGRPTSGSEGVNNRAVLRSALDMGVDVVGGAPHLDDDPVACTHTLLELAAEYERPIDLHTDESLDPARLDLEVLAEAILQSGFSHGATASHCVSLGVQTESIQRRVAEKVAAADVSVVVLPQTNLFLQARGIQQAPPRGLTALIALDAAGVRVCAGADNLQDPFCSVGRADAMETAGLMVMAGHDTPELAYHRVSTAARAAMGMGSDVTDFLAIRAGSVREAIASAPADRVVVRNGRIVFDGSTR